MSIEAFSEGLSVPGKNQIGLEAALAAYSISGVLFKKLEPAFDAREIDGYIRYSLRPTGPPELSVGETKLLVAPVPADYTFTGINSLLSSIFVHYNNKKRGQGEPALWSEVTGDGGLEPSMFVGSSEHHAITPGIMTVVDEIGSYVHGQKLNMRLRQESKEIDIDHTVDMSATGRLIKITKLFIFPSLEDAARAYTNKQYSSITIESRSMRRRFIKDAKAKTSVTPIMNEITITPYRPKVM